MAAVRFSVYAGQIALHGNKLLFFAYLPLKRASPAAARRRGTVIGDFLNRRAAAGEGLAGGGLEGPASP